MTDRCEPPPELRSADGWHWVERHQESAPMRWNGRHRGWHGPDGIVDPYRITSFGFRYLAPCPPPTTVAALVEALEDVSALDLNAGGSDVSGSLEQAGNVARAALALYRAAAKE